jgi:hypothetical protein
MYISEIIQQDFVKRNAFEKQRSKVWKVVTPRSIFAFFNNTTTHKKLDEEQKKIINDLLLVVVKRLFP